MNINELRIAVIKDFGFAPDEVVVVSGIMGVPVSFLDKYCPEQFQIVMLANGNLVRVCKQGLSRAITAWKRWKD